MERQLGIESPQAQDSLKHEQRVIAHLKKVWGLDIIETDKRRTAAYDIILSKNNTIVAIGEIKCRNEVLFKVQEVGWMLNQSKIENGCRAAKLAAVPFLAILYLTGSNQTYYWKVCDHEGRKLFNYNTEERTGAGDITKSYTVTQKVVYLPFCYAKKL